MSDHASSPLPKFASSAEDLEALRKSIDDAGSTSITLWLSYLFVLLYFAIAAGAVTDLDLLLRNAVKLPFLNIELPLVAFFALSPILLVITHAYLLVNLVVSSAKIVSFHDQLKEQIPLNDSIRTDLQRQLPNNIFVQLLAGPQEFREGTLGVFLKCISWVTIVIGPVLLLLLFQLKFLPYQDLRITWLHRVLLTADIFLLWLLRPGVLTIGNYFLSWGRLSARIAAVASACVIYFSCVVATLPDEWGFDDDAIPEWISLHQFLFKGSDDLLRHKSGSLLSNRLFLPDLNVYEALKIEDPRKLEWRGTILDLRDRRLRGAVFASANLTKVNFTLADLRGANFWKAKLQSASFNVAQLQGANLSEAGLQGASMRQVRLQQANLNKAQLQGADLSFAQIGSEAIGGQGESDEILASLRETQLQGATLNFAMMSKATLDRAQLQGASLQFANLRESSLNGTALYAADLSCVFGVPTNSEATILRDVRYMAEICVKLPGVDWQGTADAKKWIAAIERASIDDASFEKGLSEILGRLVCGGAPHSIDILHGIIGNGRLQSTGSALPELIKLINGDNCTFSNKVSLDEMRISTEAK